MAEWKRGYIRMRGPIGNALDLFDERHRVLRAATTAAQVATLQDLVREAIAAGQPPSLWSRPLRLFFTEIVWPVLGCLMHDFDGDLGRFAARLGRQIDLHDLRCDGNSLRCGLLNDPSPPPSPPPPPTSFVPGAEGYVPPATLPLPTRLESLLREAARVTVLPVGHPERQSELSWSVLLPLDACHRLHCGRRLDVLVERCATTARLCEYRSHVCPGSRNVRNRHLVTWLRSLTSQDQPDSTLPPMYACGGRCSRCAMVCDPWALFRFLHCGVVVTAKAAVPVLGPAAGVDPGDPVRPRRHVFDADICGHLLQRGLPDAPPCLGARSGTFAQRLDAILLYCNETRALKRSQVTRLSFRRFLWPARIIENCLLRHYSGNRRAFQRRFGQYFSLDAHCRRCNLTMTAAECRRKSESSS